MDDFSYFIKGSFAKKKKTTLTFELKYQLKVFITFAKKALL